APEISLRRALLEAVLVVSVMLSVDRLGTDRSLVLLRSVLALILVVNLVSIPFIAAAVHQQGEIDPDLVGDWRGLFDHKNVAGSMTAVTAMLFLFSAVERKRWVDWLVVAAALFFLVMTRSKSSLGLLPVALLAGMAYCAGWRNRFDRLIAVTVGLILAGAAAVWLAFDWDSLRRLFEDPAGFTGRTEIWQAELSYIRDHPLLGSGFGTFTDTGAPSPLAQYVSGDWVRSVSHGHSGYLQMLFMLGGIGLVLSLAAFIAAPLAQFWKIDRRTTLIRASLFSVFVFLTLHNLLESDFFQDDSAPGVIVLLMMALLATVRRERRGLEAAST
ncbi:MAG: O-antigen ligase family protein, partial [Alphaproteobacteria bacterium]|nr:O-antigen ligase family protein [Alphaproteobacteria bacterium]